MAISAITTPRADSGCGDCENCTSIYDTKAGPFTLLVDAIRDYLGDSSGIDSDQIDVTHIKSLMAAYTSNMKEWEQYALADSTRNYTRNLVDSVNGKANLILIVWNPQKGSLIHDHADAHCIMKILRGNLLETMYHMPDNTKTASSGPLSVKQETTYSTDEVAYISDKIGLHRISNPHETEYAMSLHLYTPAMKFGFNIFDESTGKASHVCPA